MAAWRAFIGELYDTTLPVFVQSAIEQFASLLEAQVLVGDWRTEYNTYRPHSALDGLTPAATQSNGGRPTNRGQQR